ncbi:hypothetical protein [Proteiniclasticum sp. QWL-01]|nr:hypothetical protein [Proteiniclasticum sp. QWL-01]WFF72161.1 hypothetical protein P6M73_12830 [Proteiniclasticum sp. QWL-01]
MLSWLITCEGQDEEQGEGQDEEQGEGQDEEQGEWQSVCQVNEIFIT